MAGDRSAINNHAKNSHLLRNHLVPLAARRRAQARRPGRPYATARKRRPRAVERGSNG